VHWQQAVSVSHNETDDKTACFIGITSCGAALVCLLAGRQSFDAEGETWQQRGQDKRWEQQLSFLGLQRRLRKHKVGPAAGNAISIR